jgi:hypothetical protein
VTAALLAAAGALSLAATPGDAPTRTHAQVAVPSRSPIASVQDASLLAAKDPVRRMRLMASLGARLVRVDLNWDAVALRRPINARDPGDPGYDWSSYDRIVDAARTAGVELLFSVWGTPAWAADTRVPPSDRFPSRATRPRDPEDFGRFGAAVVRRYAARGVLRYEAWNEPSLPLFLRPQYERRSGKWVAVSPETYSAMLTSFYREAKAVDGDVVIGGGVTAPAGEQCPITCPAEADDRVAPIAFLKALDATDLRPPMDVYTHHPYPLTRPRSVAVEGAAFIDLYNLGDLQRALDRTYLRGKRLWLTEFGFSTTSVPEYRFSVARRDQARYLADAYARVRANPRVEILTWYLLQDHPQWASGLLTQKGVRKLSASAFQLPFAAVPEDPRTGRRTLVGQIRIARRATRVAVERKAGRRWRSVALVRTSADGSFRLTVRAPVATVFRARWSGAARQGGRGAVTSPEITPQVE